MDAPLPGNAEPQFVHCKYCKYGQYGVYPPKAHEQHRFTAIFVAPSILHCVGISTRNLGSFLFGAIAL